MHITIHETVKPGAVAPLRMAGHNGRAVRPADIKFGMPEEPVVAVVAVVAAAAAAPQATIDVTALYRQHRTHLLRFVQRYLGNQSDAEDVVQNTFVEALRCADRFSGLSKPSTWLFGIALNLARNQGRRNGADRYETVEEDFMEQLVDIHADPALQYEWRQMARKVDRLIGDLPPKIRATFLAVLEGELTYEEAARDLQIPIGTVRSRISRVRTAARLECGR
jgi:RNA polymerase sigma factor (sigma-70 family)